MMIACMSFQKVFRTNLAVIYGFTLVILTNVLPQTSILDLQASQDKPNVDLLVPPPSTIEFAQNGNFCANASGVLFLPEEPYAVDDVEHVSRPAMLCQCANMTTLARTKLVSEQCF